MKPLYTASVHVEGGRDGKAKSSDGLLSLSLAMPKVLGGNGQGTNPEQLFAAGYAACFESAMRFVAKGKKQSVGEPAVDADVALYPKPEGGFLLGVAMKVSVPGLSQKEAEELVAEAHKICPYSNATRGNIDVGFTVSGKK